MFTRLATLLPIAALVAVAAAAPGGRGGDSSHGSSHGSSQCTTGSAQCCSNTYASNDPTITKISALLSADLPNVSGLVGAGCTPITGIGASSGGQCDLQPICCTDQGWNGLVNVGCNPISASG